jgi:hypothetical protein
VESGSGDGRGVGEERRRVALIGHPPVDQHQQRARVLGDQAHVVGDDDDRAPVGADLLEQREQSFGLCLVLTERRLVEDDHLLPTDEHGGHAQPALLTLTQREWVRLREGVEAESLQPRLHLRGPGLVEHAAPASP